MTLDTKRLTLKIFKKSMISELYLKSLNDKSIVGMTEARHTVWNKKNAEDFIENSNSNSSKMIAVFLKNSKQIGNIRLFNINYTHKRAELSLLFYDKSEWGKGYASEAITAIISYAFKNLKLHRVYADHYSNNIGSSKMFKKVGFKEEGVFKDHFVQEDNSYLDSVRIAIINNTI